VRVFTPIDDVDVDVKEVEFAYPVQLLELADVVAFPLNVVDIEELDELELELEVEDELELVLVLVIVANIACTILASAEVMDAK